MNGLKSFPKEYLYVFYYPSILTRYLGILNNALYSKYSEGMFFESKGSKTSAPSETLWTYFDIIVGYKDHKVSYLVRLCLTSQTWTHYSHTWTTDCNMIITDPTPN